MTMTSWRRSLYDLPFNFDHAWVSAIADRAENIYVPVTRSILSDLATFAVSTNFSAMLADLLLMAI